MIERTKSLLLLKTAVDFPEEYLWLGNSKRHMYHCTVDNIEFSLTVLGKSVRVHDLIKDKVSNYKLTAEEYIYILDNLRGVIKSVKNSLRYRTDEMKFDFLFFNAVNEKDLNKLKQKDRKKRMTKLMNSDVWEYRGSYYHYSYTDKNKEIELIYIPYRNKFCIKKDKGEWLLLPLILPMIHKRENSKGLKQARDRIKYTYKSIE